jgi:acetyl esterase
MPLDPQIAAMAEAMAASPDTKPTHELSPRDAREGYRALGAMLGPAPAVANVVNRKLPRPGGQIPVRVYTPEGTGPFAVLVFFHGGGWVIGDLDTHDRECRILCNGAGCIVVAVDYRLAPEHPFPAAVEDSFVALQWVGKHAAEIGGDPRRIAVGGDSAGGNLAAVVSLLARDSGGPSLRFQLLIYPTVDVRDDAEYRSRTQNADGPFLLRATMDYFVAHYLKDCPAAVRNDTRVSPLAAGSHRGLPPALVVTAEYDVLRDEGEAYARALEGAGIPVTLHRYDGMPHLFFQLSAVIPQSKKLLEESCAALREALA